jgi:hypothetical protein
MGMNILVQRLLGSTADAWSVIIGDCARQRAGAERCFLDE